MEKKDFIDQYPRTTFRLGITMAGAVSAGAYCAGVMSYLLETLQLWQEQKEKKLNRMWEAAMKFADDRNKNIKDYSVEEIYQNGLKGIPKDSNEDKEIASTPLHDTIIEVFGGASAGSLVAAISILSLGYKIDYTPSESATEQDVDLDQNIRKDGIMYDSWIKMNMNEPSDPIEVLLRDGEDDDSEKYFSILNGSLLDQLADVQLNKLFGPEKNKRERQLLPKYISKNLQAFFSLTSLKGINMGIRFSETNDTLKLEKIPAHYVKLHSFMAHFQMGEKNTNTPYKIDPHHEEWSRFLIKVAIASGAFPIGLPPRKLKLSNEYIRNQVKKYFKDMEVVNEIVVELEADQCFEFTAVDGGTLNNEPFTEVSDALETIKSGNDIIAAILIDPFPNFEKDRKYKHPITLKEIVFSLIGAIRGQAMVKSPASLKPSSNSKKFTGMIFPSRRNEKREKLVPALASATLAGFGGFFSEKFREHDYILGKKNCQSFIRQYFHLPESAANELESFQAYKTKGWQDEKYTIERDGQKWYPIVPDISINPKWKSTDEKNILDNGISPSPFEKMNKKEISKYEDSIQRRLKHLVTTNILSLLTLKKTTNQEKLETGNPKKSPIFKSKKIFFRPFLFALLLAILVVIWMVAFMGLESTILIFIFSILVIWLLLLGLLKWSTKKIMQIVLDRFNEKDQLESE